MGTQWQAGRQAGVLHTLPRKLSSTHVMTLDSPEELCSEWGSESAPFGFPSRAPSTTFLGHLQQSLASNNALLEPAGDCGDFGNFPLAARSGERVDS